MRGSGLRQGPVSAQLESVVLRRCPGPGLLTWSEIWCDVENSRASDRASTAVFPQVTDSRVHQLYIIPLHLFHCSGRDDMERYVRKHQKEPGHQTRDTASPVDNVRSPGDNPGSVPSRIQISQICAATTTGPSCSPKIQNGGSVRGYHMVASRFRNSSRPAVGQHAAAWPEYLCIESRTENARSCRDEARPPDYQARPSFHLSARGCGPSCSDADRRACSTIRRQARAYPPIWTNSAPAGTLRRSPHRTGTCSQRVVARRASAATRLDGECKTRPRQAPASPARKDPTMSSPRTTSAPTAVLQRRAGGHRRRPAGQHRPRPGQ